MEFFVNFDILGTLCEDNTCQELPPDVCISTVMAAIEEQIALKRHNEWLIIRGGHNASIGKLEQKLHSTKARGKYRCGASNEAGRDLIAWCEMNV